jgi:DNA repair exonuclease SbcCD ATPase subunit
MIILEKVRYKNLLSVGNTFTEIELNKNPTTLIVGKNGSSKSTVIESITFALFKKAYRPINLPQLINSINEKDCLVELEFSINSTQWMVRRGLRPNIFELYRDGQLLEQDASAIDQQRWFEQNVLKMNYKTFIQIVILGSSNYVPFMQLPLASRREIIEDLLDIRIFSSMNLILKEKLKSLKDDLKQLNVSEKHLHDKVVMQRRFIEEIEKESNTRINEKQQRIDGLSQLIDKTIEVNQKFEAQIDKLNQQISDVSASSSKLKQLGTLKGKISQKVGTINRELLFFQENSICPTCTQNIEEDFKTNKISEYQKSSEEFSNALNEINEAIESQEEKQRQFSNLSNLIVQLNQKTHSNNIQISTAQRQISELNEEIETIQDSVQNRNTENEKLSQIEEELLQIQTDFLNKKDSLQYYEYMASLLKDGGVKTKIIRKYLPIINQLINKYLNTMDMFINFTFDEEFNETINSPLYDNFSYSSFSEGQKQRINLSILWTFRELVKIKNSTNVNLLVFDEILDSSLDDAGIEEFIRIVKYVFTDTNTFIISHREGVTEKFEHILEFEKHGNFSHLKNWHT